MKIEEIEEIRRLIRTGYYEGTVFNCGMVYKGCSFNGLPHGKGILILPSGKTYEYQFNNGILSNGYQIRIYDNGYFYEGEILRNLPHGQGIVRNINGSDIYEGTWFSGCICEDSSRIVWFCTDIIWGYENGKIFKMESPARFNSSIGIGAIPFYHYLLYPGICLKDTYWPNTDRKKFGTANSIMFPHLADLGCPPSDNLVSGGGFASSPELAVQSVGFSDLKDYIKSIYMPEIKAARNLLDFIKPLKYSLTFINYFSHDPLIKHFKKGLTSFEKIIKEDMERLEKSGINELAKEVEQYYNSYPTR